MLTALLFKAKSWALMALAILAVLFGAYAYGGRKAKQVSNLEQDKRRADEAEFVTKSIIKTMETQNVINQEVADMSDADAYSELRDKWTRD